jgi:hypothetical protein
MAKKTTKVFPLPEEFAVTPAIRELAKKHGWANPDGEIEWFRDYHRAAGNLFADWEAAFRTWMRRTLTIGPSGAKRPMVRGLLPPMPPVKKSEPAIKPERTLSVEEQQAKLAELRKTINGLAAAKSIDNTTEDQRRAELQRQADLLRGRR